MGIIQKKPWENHKNLNLGFRTLTLSPLSPYILGPNLFAYKLGFCYDPSPSIWANDPNSALFFLAGFPKRYRIAYNITTHIHDLALLKLGMHISPAHY